MNAQLDLFGAKPSTDDGARRHDLKIVRGAGEAAMTKFAIVVTERSGNKTELCRVGSNPEAVAEGARRKTTPLGRSRRTRLYIKVEVVELEP